jgi:hypothetical protein
MMIQLIIFIEACPCRLHSFLDSKLWVKSEPCFQQRFHTFTYHALSLVLDHQLDNSAFLEARTLWIAHTVLYIGYSSWWEAKPDTTPKAQSLQTVVRRRRDFLLLHLDRYDVNLFYYIMNVLVTSVSQCQEDWCRAPCGLWRCRSWKPKWRKHPTFSLSARVICQQTFGLIASVNVQSYNCKSISFIWVVSALILTSFAGIVLGIVVFQVTCAGPVPMGSTWTMSLEATALLNLYQ